jgi:hypothetical protein
MKTFSRREMTRFCEFAHSPYFNKHVKVKGLVKFLSDVYPDFSEKNCQREVVFKRLYPTLPHDQSKLALIFTYTYKLLEQFLRQQSAEMNGILISEELLLRNLRGRDFLDLFEKKLEERVGGGKNMTVISKGATELQDSRYFEDSYKLAKEKDACAARKSHSEHQFFIEKQFWLNAFYICEKLRDACEMRQRKRLFQVDFDDRMLNKVSDEIGDNEETYAALAPIMVYYYIRRLLDYEDEASFKSVVSKVEDYETKLSMQELQNVYNYLQNYCIEQINKGNQDFLKELFKIYQSQLQKKLLIAEGYLPEWHYKNIVTTGLRLNEMAWVKSFLENYKNRLHPDVAENAYSYNLAAFYHQSKAYNKVLDLLIKVEYTDLRYNLDAKSLLLRTYYELGEEDALLALADSFRQFLKRNKQMSEFQKKGYFNLLKFTKKSFQLKMSRNYTAKGNWHKQVSLLQVRIAEANTIFNQSWLESKVEELVVKVS